VKLLHVVERLLARRCPGRHANEIELLVKPARVRDCAISFGDPFVFILRAAGEENAGLRQELDKVSQRLADRKVLDRAKGLLQAHFSWTEEEAYLHLRRESRQRRTAMREIAQEVIESGKLLEARHAG